MAPFKTNVNYSHPLLKRLQKKCEFLVSGPQEIRDNISTSRLAKKTSDSPNADEGLLLLQAFVSCGLGVHMVGYVMICYGVCDAICSITFSPLVKMVGRVPIFTMGALINLSIIITLRHWMPHPDDVALFFLMAGLWGVSDAVWQTQINGM